MASLFIHMAGNTPFLILIPAWWDDLSLEVKNRSSGTNLHSFSQMFVINFSSFSSFDPFHLLLFFLSLSIYFCQKAFLMDLLVDLKGAIIRKGESAPLCSDTYFLLVTYTPSWGIAKPSCSLASHCIEINWSYDKVFTDFFFLTKTV